jgi:hypothetical protein
VNTDMWSEAFDHHFWSENEKSDKCGKTTFA